MKQKHIRKLISNDKSKNKFAEYTSSVFCIQYLRDITDKKCIISSTVEKGYWLNASYYAVSSNVGDLSLQFAN